MNSLAHAGDSDMKMLTVGTGDGGKPRSRSASVASIQDQIVEMHLNVVGSNNKVDSRPDQKQPRQRPSTVNVSRLQHANNGSTNNKQQRKSHSKASIDVSGTETDTTDSDVKNSVYRIARNIRLQRRRAAPIEERPRASNSIEPTYRVQPECKFDVLNVRAIACETMMRFLSQEHQYNPRNGKKLVVGLSELLKERIKLLDLRRFKLIVNVVLGEINDQGVEVATRSLIDSSTDDFCVAEYKSSNSRIFATAIIFGIYRE